MSVPRSATVQSLEEIHRLICAAVVQRRPIAAVYDDARRLFCPHVVGYNGPCQYRVFCYQYGGESTSGLHANSGVGWWRCIDLAKLRSVELLYGPWQTEPHARQRCVKHVEVDADDYPDGDPQHGQCGS